MQSCAALLIHSDTGSGFYKNTTWLERLDLDLGALGALFEECIEEVGRLERRRAALVSELLEAERPLAEGVQALRAELGHAHKQLQHCDLQKEDLRESMRLLKRQLFAVAKACAQSQMELSSRKHDVQQLGTLQVRRELSVAASASASASASACV